MLPTAIMREVLMGLERDYSLRCWNAHDQKAHPAGLEDCRVSLLGNSVQAPTVSWLLSFHKHRQIFTLSGFHSNYEGSSEGSYKSLETSWALS